MNKISFGTRVLFTILFSYVFFFQPSYSLFLDDFFSLSLYTSWEFYGEHKKPHKDDASVLIRWPMLNASNDFTQSYWQKDRR